MDCGAKDFICYLVGLMAQYGLEISGLLKWVPWIRETFVQNLQAIIGVLGFSFGVWRWWYFRERVLHKRLKKYLAEQDSRLIEARTYIVDALYRPGSKRLFSEPLFAVKPLRRVLRREKWEAILNTQSIEIGADRLLDKAIRQIESRLEAADDQMRSYRNQQANAHILKGAIAAARAPNMITEIAKTRLDTVALNEFRTAQQVAGHEKNAQTKLFEAHQLRKLGYHQEAEMAYKEAADLAEAEDLPRDKDFLVARTKHWQAAIHQARAIHRRQRGQQGGSGSQIANQLISQALAARSQYSPFHDWDAIEQGDLHYLSAFVFKNLEAVVQAPIQLDKAITEYQRVIDGIPVRRRLVSPSARRLFKSASAGVERARKAKRGEYDTNWLVPPLKQTEEETSGIAETSGEKSIHETA